MRCVLLAAVMALAMGGPALAQGYPTVPLPPIPPADQPYVQAMLPPPPPPPPPPPTAAQLAEQARQDQISSWETIMRQTGAAAACGVLTQYQVGEVVTNSTPDFVASAPLSVSGPLYTQMYIARMRGAYSALNNPMVCEQLLYINSTMTQLLGLAVPTRETAP